MAPGFKRRGFPGPELGQTARWDNEPSLEFAREVGRRVLTPPFEGISTTRSPALAQCAIEVVSRADQCQMCKSLREIPQLLAVQPDLLRIQPQVIRVSE